jgi:hypothetical protein
MPLSLSDSVRIAASQGIPTEKGPPVTRKKRRRNDFKRLALVSAVFLSAVFTLYTVTTIYTGNVESFSFELKYLLLVSTAPFLAIVLVLSLPAVLLRGLLLKVYAYSLCFVAVAAWLYSGVFVSYFGLLDGKSWDFSRFDGYKYYEIFAIAVLWFVLYNFVVKRPRLITYLILLLNLGLMSLTAWSLVQDPKESSLDPRPNLDALYHLSSEQNVLIVLMDAFQSDVFRELLDEDSSLAAQLQGFTFFPDTLGVAASTYLTLPSIHTGQVYKAGMNLQEFYSRNIREGSFLNSLAAAGHEVTLVNPIRGDCPELIELCIGIQEVLYGKRRSLVMETAFLLDLSLLRAVPHFYKRAIYNNRSWHISPLVSSYLTHPASNEPGHIIGNQVLQRFGSLGRVVGDRPVTKFLHLLSTHRPYVQDANCNIVSEDDQDIRLGAKYQSHCALEAFLYFLDKLRRTGVYDRSLILLIADTGAGLHSSYITQIPKKSLWRRLVGRANPIFLVKAPGAQGPLRENLASIQPSDVPATVCAITQLCDNNGGISVLDAAAPSRRARIFWHYIWRDGSWGELPNIRGFELAGPIWDRDSWLNYTESDWGRY